MICISKPCRPPLSEGIVPPSHGWYLLVREGGRERFTQWQPRGSSHMGKNTFLSHLHDSVPSLEPLLETLPDQLQVLIMRWQYWWLALLEPACVTEADGKYVRKRPSLISLNILQWLFSTSEPSHILFVTCQVSVLIHHNLSLPLSVIKKPMAKMTDRCKQDFGNYSTEAGGCLNIVLFLPIKQVLGLHSPGASDRGEADYIMTLQCRLADQTKWISLSN